MQNEIAKKNKLFALSLGSIGMVYGDIGTSPLYAFKESILSASKLTGTIVPEMVYGVLSLVIWTLFIIVTLKYVVLLLRADNEGEGGILSLMALAKKGCCNTYPRLGGLILTMGILGAALFYGDSIITPAISVLSALEGLSLVEHSLHPFVIPIAIIVILTLFIVQVKGTTKIARYFGPIMALWFLALAYGGIIHIQENPDIWKSFNPYYGYYFLTHYGKASFIVLGAIFLAVTGAEALYADLGHFGKKPMRFAWLFFVMPALLLNYMGQGALVLNNPAAAENSFYLLYPSWAAWPIIILATMATVIASQAVITGAFSLTHQAVQLGLLPRLKVEYTSHEQKGQIYMPQINWLLMIGVVLVIGLFHTSSAMAAAYGIAVSGTMIISVLLLFSVMHFVWKWRLWQSLLIVLPLLIIDIIFFSANSLKFFEGGFMPALLSLVLVILIKTWIKGSSLLSATTRGNESIKSLIKMLDKSHLSRVKGTAVFFSSSSVSTPAALLDNIKHNHVLHERNILLTIKFVNKPHVIDKERVSIKKVGKDFIRVYMSFGFMEQADVMKGMHLLRKQGIKLTIYETSFFISRRNILPSAKFGMPLWQDKIFIMLASNASDAASSFNLPMHRVVELGGQYRF